MRRQKVRLRSRVCSLAPHHCPSYGAGCGDSPVAQLPASTDAPNAKKNSCRLRAGNFLALLRPGYQGNVEHLAVTQPLCSASSGLPNQDLVWGHLCFQTASSQPRAIKEVGRRWDRAASADDRDAHSPARRWPLRTQEGDLWSPRMQGSIGT